MWNLWNSKLMQFTQKSEKYLNLQSSRFSSELNQRLSCEATSTKKVREKSHKETERKQKTIEKQKKKIRGGRRSFVIFQTKKEKQLLAAFLHLNHLNTFGESWRRYILFWKTDVLLWSHWNATQQRSQHPLKEKAAHARLWRSFFFVMIQLLKVTASQ